MDKKINPWIVLINNLRPVEFLPYRRLHDLPRWRNWAWNAHQLKIHDGNSHYQFSSTKEENEKRMRELKQEYNRVEDAAIAAFNRAGIGSGRENHHAFVFENFLGEKIVFWFHDWSIYYYSEM